MYSLLQSIMHIYLNCMILMVASFQSQTIQVEGTSKCQLLGMSVPYTIRSFLFHNLA